MLPLLPTPFLSCHFAEKMQINRLLGEAYALCGVEKCRTMCNPTLASRNERFLQIVTSEIPALLRIQLRGAHVGVYASIKMDQVYVRCAHSVPIRTAARWRLVDVNNVVLRTSNQLT